MSHRADFVHVAQSCLWEQRTTKHETHIVTGKV